MGTSMLTGTSRVFSNPYPILHRPDPEGFSDFGYGAYFENRSASSNADIEIFSHNIASNVRNSVVDLRINFGSSYPPVMNQGSVNACTAYSVTAVVMCTSLLQRMIPLWRLEPLFLYGETLRAILRQTLRTSDADRLPASAVPAWQRSPLQEPVLVDSGATLLDAFLAAKKMGISSSDATPPGFSWDSVPDARAKKSAAAHRPGRIASVEQSLDSLCAAMAMGYAIGFTVAISAEANRWMRDVSLQRPTYVFPTPWGAQDVGSVVGAHAVAIVGYSDVGKIFTVRNSWGPGWGDDGHFFMSYQTVLTPQWCRDFFVVLDVVT